MRRSLSRFVSVNIKWGKEKFSDVECNTDEPPELFKAQLFALSGVAPDRQKVMVKGAVIKVKKSHIRSPRNYTKQKN